MIRFNAKSLGLAAALSALLLADAALAGSVRPLVIGHRGASGYRPEHTLAAYRLAIDMGADFVEPDLVPTKDGVLVCRHENEIGGTTDVATKPEFASRMTTKLIDGVSFTGWFTEDFTLAELKTLRAKERIPGTRPANTAYNGLYEVPTLTEVIQMVKDFEALTGRKIGIYPETKHPTYFALEGARLDGTPINTSLGQLLINTLVAENFTDPSRIFIQSFEFANLIELQNVIMPSANLDIPLVQLYGDFSNTNLQPASNFSRPYDMRYNALVGANLAAIYGGLLPLVPGGITPTTHYGELASNDILAWMKTNYAEGIGPWKNSFLLRTGTPAVDCDGNGTAQVTAKLTGAVAPWFGVAVALGFDIHPYTLRSEEVFLTLNADGTCQDIYDEAQQLLSLGATGFFIDQPDDGYKGRELWERNRSVRFATFNASLNRSNAGELITALSSPFNAQAQAVAEIIQRVNADVVLINEFDYDAGDVAANLFRTNYLQVSQNGVAPVTYPYLYNAPSNTGVPSGFDFNNNGSTTDADDALGFGFFPGQFGMLLLSKYPIVGARTFQNFKWKDMPGALLPDNALTPEPADWYTDEELEVLPVSSKSHWDISINVDGRIIHALCAHPTPPVFDGPEDRNGRRNYDEIRLWADYIADTAGYLYDDANVFGGLPAGSNFVILGDYNADPLDGDAYPGAIHQYTNNPLINNTCTPESDGGFEAVLRQGGANLLHVGNPRFDTGDFADTAPGNLRADYVLPSANQSIVRSGAFWPISTDPLFPLVGPGFPFVSSDHRMVWVDIETPTIAATKPNAVVRPLQPATKTNKKATR